MLWVWWNLTHQKTLKQRSISNQEHSLNQNLKIQFHPGNSYWFLELQKKTKTATFSFLPKKHISKIPWTGKKKHTTNTKVFPSKTGSFHHTLDAFPSITELEGTGFNLGCAIQARASWICGGLEPGTRGFRYVFCGCFWRWKTTKKQKQYLLMMVDEQKLARLKGYILCIGCTQNGFGELGTTDYLPKEVVAVWLLVFYF